MEGLNSEDTLKRITLKLPSSVGVRWCHLANKMLKSEQRLSMFHDVVKFVMQEASLATDPVFLPKPLRKQGKMSSPTLPTVTTVGEELRAQVASQQMPHLPKSTCHHLLRVDSVIASITV